MKSLKTQRTWFLTGALSFLLISIISCSSTSTPMEVHGFSNLVLDNNELWFGAGYKLYQIDLNQRIAKVIYDAKNVVISYVQIDGNRLYFEGNHYPESDGSTIWSLDLDKESIEWKKDIKYDWMGGGYIVIPPLVGNDVLIVGTRTSLYGFDKLSGDVKWQIKNNWFGSGERLTPILSNEQLFYGLDEISGSDPKNRIIAIADPSTGKTLKTISMPEILGAIPAIHGNCLFVKDDQYVMQKDATGTQQWIGELRLNCVDLNSGAIVWTFQENGVPESSQPSFYNGLVFDVFANQLYAIDERSGTLNWQSPELEAAARNPQIIEGANVIALEIPSSEKVIFLDLNTGKLLDKGLLNALSSPVFVGQDAIYGTTYALVRVNITTGDAIWSIPIDSQYLGFPDH